jgi:hypothetical protein
MALQSPSSKTDAPAEAKKEREPIITPEADHAIFGVMKKYGLVAFALVVMLPVLFGILYSRYPHSKIMGVSGPISWIAAMVWLIPWYIGQSKVSDMRIAYGRQYAGERRWREVVAALNPFSEWGQRTFDRTGEAHYLLSLGLDKLGRKEKAESMRQFVRKHRAGTQWAVKCGAPASSETSSATPGRRKAALAPTETDTEAGAPRAKTTTVQRGRRRRF